MTQDFALIGFGEAGSTFARAGEWKGRARAFDIDLSRADSMRASGVLPCTTAAEAVGGVPLVLSLVTADRAEAVARDCAGWLSPGTIWCDMNSVAPQTKQAAAEAVDAAGAHYVDVAILAPVDPSRFKVPLLLSGPAALDAMAMLLDLGFTALRTVGPDVGRASAIKMIRSIMVKGLEALTDEMMHAAEAAGVTGEVLASLDASERQQSWTDRAAYNLERMDRHGLRRAAEMEEVARTLTDLGVDPVMTLGAVRRQADRGGKAKERSQ